MFEVLGHGASLVVDRDLRKRGYEKFLVKGCVKILDGTLIELGKRNVK